MILAQTGDKLMQKTIIAIEDDPQIAELLQVLLASNELTTHSYANGEEGLAAVIANPPDLVLLDIMVPGLNGWDVYDRIRQHEDEKVRQVPIIIVSVTQLEFDRRETFARSKSDFYVTKPFDVLQLRGKINSLLNISHWQVGGTMPKPLRTKVDEIRPIASKLLEDTAESPSAKDETQETPKQIQADDKAKHDA